MRSYADDYPGHARQYGLLRNTISNICNDLGLNDKNMETKRTESSAGSTYRTRIVGEYTLNFELDTFVKKNKIQKIMAYIGIKYDSDSVSFQIHDDITKYINQDNYLERWAAHAIHKFNLEHNPINLNTRFGESILKVYGYSDNPLSLKEMSLLLDGMQKTKTDKILAYKFRHVDTLMRTYSYCFFVSDGYYPNFWVFFLNLGGLDSGGHSESLRLAESIIASKTEVELRPADIEYVRLRKFLSERVQAFNFEGENTLIFNLFVLGDFDPTFFELYSKFLERYKNEEYSEALRNLRVLVQMSMETVYKKNQIQIPKKPSINTLCSELIKNEILDEVMRAWCCAFTSVANLSAHREFPSNDEFFNQNTEDRIKITILLGIYIINSLGDTIDVLDDSYDDSTHS